VPSVQWRVASFLERSASAAEKPTARYEAPPSRELTLTETPELTERITYTIPWRGPGGPRVKEIYIASEQTGTKTAHMMSPEPSGTVLVSQRPGERSTPMLVVPALAVEQRLATPFHAKDKGW
jgi:hypothetical protein